MLHYQVPNMSNLPLGDDSETSGSLRAVEVRIYIPSTFGRLLGEGEKGEKVLQAVPCIRLKDSHPMRQQFRVLWTAQIHKHFLVTFEL